MRCKICGKITKATRNLKNHLTRKHKDTTIIDYINRFYYNNSFKFELCGWCNKNTAIPIYSVITDTQCYLYYENRYLCNDTNCKTYRRTINPMSYESFSKTQKISIEQAKIEVGKRNPFHIEYFDGDEEKYADFQRRDKQYYINKYGETNGIRRYEECCQKISHHTSRTGLIERYGEERAEEICASRGITLESLINKYGETDGTKRYKTWIKTISLTEENFIRRHGNIEGPILWEMYRQKLAFSQSYEGYILRFGEELGNKKWQEHREKCAITEEKMINLYGEEEGKKRYCSFNESRILGMKNSLLNNGVSTIALEFLSEIRNKSKLDIIDFENGGEWYIRIDDSCYAIDGYNKKYSIAIEFFGTYWHADERKYIDETLMFNNLSASEIRERDIKRLNNIATKINYIIIVRELDYKENSESAIDKVIEIVDKIKSNKLMKGIYFV